MKKQGFTLIELMVVIVIMGILAAVAVPKLFGMIAKSRASEIYPAAGSWIHCQEVYYQEKETVGNWTDIGYHAPGIWDKSNSANYTKSFIFSGAESAEWIATPSTGALNSCTTSMSWKLKASAANQDVKIADNGSNPACTILTPSWKSLEKN